MEAGGQLYPGPSLDEVGPQLGCLDMPPADWLDIVSGFLTTRSGAPRDLVGSMRSYAGARQGHETRMDGEHVVVARALVSEGGWKGAGDLFFFLGLLVYLGMGRAWDAGAGHLEDLRRGLFGLYDRSSGLPLNRFGWTWSLMGPGTAPESLVQGTVDFSSERIVSSGNG